MEPEWVDLEAFRVIGLPGWFGRDPHLHIPELWERFVPHMCAVPNVTDARCFGICRGTPAGLLYLAAVPVSSLDEIPPDLVGKTIPAARYAVFTHRGHVSGLHETIRDAWKTWLPASGHEADPGKLDFELYDERFDGSTGSGEVDYYLPVRAPA